MSFSWFFRILGRILFYSKCIAPLCGCCHQEGSECRPRPADDVQ